MNAAILKDVSLTLGGKTILKDISFEIEQGGFYAVIGPNGAGKSTLLKVMTRLAIPSAGEVLINGCNIDELDRRGIAQNIAVVPAVFETTFAFTAYDIVLAARSAQPARSK